MKRNDVDLVFPWVDGSDPAWLSEKAKYDPKGGDARNIRYRGWDNLRFLFRGIERFLPWVRKVHFITWGHLPVWLNTDCERLHVVRHEDYIPEKYLPTFSSHPIELNLHRIEDLSERFIYANDDMFYLQPMEEECFFQNGLPVDSAVQNVLQFHRPDGIDHIVANDLCMLNLHFDKKACISRNRKKWFTVKYGKGALQNLYLQQFSNFTGFAEYHLPNAFLLDTFREIWEKEPEIMDATCRNRFRTGGDVNQWLMRYWQLASGRFVPAKPNRGEFLVIGKDDDRIRKTILEQAVPMICLSDDDPDLDFEKEKAFVNGLFEKILPEKSRFEKE